MGWVRRQWPLEAASGEKKTTISHTHRAAKQNVFDEARRATCWMVEDKAVEERDDKGGWEATATMGC